MVVLRCSAYRTSSLSDTPAANPTAHAAHQGRLLSNVRSPALLRHPSNCSRIPGQLSQGAGLPLLAPRPQLRQRHWQRLGGRPAAAAAAGPPSGSGDDAGHLSGSEAYDSDAEHSGVGQQRQQGSGGMVERALQLPLEMGVATSRTDSQYLEKRDKKNWWNKEAFPKVPVESLEQVHRHPPPLQLWQKVAPLGLIFFGASFNLTILQTLKDAIMVTTAGAETLPFLSSFCVLPASIAFFMLYGRMVETLPPRAVFYAAVTPLLAFYTFFAAVMYPLAGVLHPHGLQQALATVVPVGLHGLVKVVEYWSFSLFFCLAELWGSVVISVLFWGLANEVCSVSEARAVYPLMGIAANVALVVAGSLVKMVNRTVAAGSPLLSLRCLVGTVVAMSVVMMLAKAGIDRFVLTSDSNSKPPVKKKKKKGSFADSFAVLTSSPKIRNLALLVMSYGVSHRLFEFAWKGQLRLLYPTSAAYQHVLADVSIATGYTTIALMLLGRFVFQFLGWGVAAAATPSVMMLAGGAFFFLSLAANQGISVAGLNPATMALAGALAGAVTQVFARSSKFSLFDPAKEMVYIEMTKEEKSKGKAAVDLVGSQIGKSGAAWLTQLLLLALGSITASLPIISFTFVSVITCWLGAVRSLDKQLKEYEEQKKAAGEAEAGAAPEEGSAGANGSAAAPAANGAHTERPTNGAQEQGSPAFVVNAAATGGGGMVMEGGLA